MPPPPGSFSASVTVESWAKIDVSLRSLDRSPEAVPNAWKTPVCSEAVQPAGIGFAPVHLVLSRNEAASAVSASLNFPW